MAYNALALPDRLGKHSFYLKIKTKKQSMENKKQNEFFQNLSKETV